MSDKVILTPGQVARLLFQMSDEEAAECLRVCEPGDEMLFCERASEWLIRWKARQQGGGIG